MVCTARDGRKYTLGDLPGRPHPNCNCRLQRVAGTSGSATQAAEATPLEDLWYPEVDTTIFADCTMASVGKLANMVQLRCNVSTGCIPTDGIDAHSFRGYVYRGVYQAFLGGLGFSKFPVSASKFTASFEISGDYKKLKTPLHAMEGWANVEVLSAVFGAGPSISRFELGNTLTLSIDWELGVDIGGGWYGGRGQLLSFSSSQCGVSRD